MVAAWLQLVGGLLVLMGATPALFGHPYARFAGLRYAVGVTMLVAVLGMAVFLLQHDWIAVFVLGALCGLLGWLGAGLLLRRMEEYAGLAERRRRRLRRRLPDFRLAAMVWTGSLLTTVGLALSLLQGV